MTEAEWRTSKEPCWMLSEVEGHWRYHERYSGKSFNWERFRLYACACARRIWDLLDEDHRNALLLAEQHAVQPVPAELRAARRKVGAKAMIRLHDAAVHAGNQYSKDHPVYLLALARQFAAEAVHAATVARPDKITDTLSAARAAGLRDLARKRGNREKRQGTLDWHAIPRKEFAAQAPLVRDIFDNSFRPIQLNPALRSPQVTTLAEAAYEERQLPAGTVDRHRLAVLAGALDEAGCMDTTILDHLRGPGPHIRGCWVLDLLRPE
jgi:hypothetical protein